MLAFASVRLVQALLTVVTLTAGLAASATALAADKLIILSPHRKSVQDEFVPAFKSHYKKTFGTEVEVEWLDQGGTSDDVRFLKAKLAKNPASAGIDIFWGGGGTTFTDMSRDKMLAPYKLPADLAKQVPASAAGVPLTDKETWYASAMSSFGIFFNKKVLKFDGLPEPKTWKDLANPKFLNQLSLADPRRSGTAGAMNNIVLQGMGWDKGWELLTQIAGNTSKFMHSSSDPVKAIVSGDAAASMVIDFYAIPKVTELGEDNLGFVLPEGQTVIDPDPIAIVKGAPNRTAAERFVNFVLSADAQKLLILPVGQKDGPKIAALGRMAVNTAAYDQTEGRRSSAYNPFKQKAVLKIDADRAAKMQQALNDLVGAIHIDTHGDLKAAWASIVKRGAKAADIAELSRSPVTEAELLKLAEKWDDNVLRNKTINEWVAASKAKYAKLAKLAQN